VHCAILREGKERGRRRVHVRRWEKEGGRDEKYRVKERG
jgi:hypothetical protein